MFDRRWQMVLDCVGTESPPFSQGVLVDFRQRVIAHDMDRRLVERTVELARETGGFGYKALRRDLQEHLRRAPDRGRREPPRLHFPGCRPPHPPLDSAGA